MAAPSFVPAIRARIRRVRIQLAIAGFYFVSSLSLGLYYPQAIDAAYYLIFARHITREQALPLATTEFASGSPVLPILGAISNALTGMYIVVPAAMGAIAVFGTYSLVRRWYDEQLARTTALIMMVHPFLLLWGGRFLVGTSILAGFVVVFYLYFRYLETDDRYLLYAVLILGGGLRYVKIYGAAAITIIVAHLLVMRVAQSDDGISEALTAVARKVGVPFTLAALLAAVPNLLNLLLHADLFPKLTGSGAEPRQVGLAVFLPTPRELYYFATQFFGLNPPNLIFQDLGTFSWTLRVLWLVLPLFVFCVGVIGIRRRERNATVDTFVAIWVGTFIGLYLVQRVLSRGNVAFLYRHFITLTPVVCVTFAMAYRKIDVDISVKRLFAVLFVCLLLAQMLFGVFLYHQHMAAVFGPVVSYTEDEISEDDPIYTTSSRDLRYRLEDHTFTKEVDDASVIILANSNRLPADVDRYNRRDCLDLITRRDSRAPFTVASVDLGEIGSLWSIYRPDRTTESCRELAA